MIDLDAETFVRYPPQIGGCAVTVRAVSYNEARAIAGVWENAVVEGDRQKKVADYVSKYVVAIAGLKAGGVDITPANLVELAPVYVVQAVLLQVIRASSLEGQQGLDSKPPLSGGVTASDGNAPPVIDVPGA